MTPLCERADGYFRVASALLAEWPSDAPFPFPLGTGREIDLAPSGMTPHSLLEQGCTMRCKFCPLFVVLGEAPEDAGCQSLVDPIISAVRRGARDLARTQVEKVIRLLEAIPLPPDDPLLPAQGTT